MKKNDNNNKQITVVWMKSVHSSVDLAFEIILKQHTNVCNQSQTDTYRNNHSYIVTENLVLSPV